MLEVVVRGAVGVHAVHGAVAREERHEDVEARGGYEGGPLVELLGTGGEAVQKERYPAEGDGGIGYVANRLTRGLLLIRDALHILRPLVEVWSLACRASERRQ